MVAIFNPVTRYYNTSMVELNCVCCLLLMADILDILPLRLSYASLCLSVVIGA